jgi:hypothetical protein
MLVVPVFVTGSTPYSFEFRNEWQRAWARFRTGNSPVDYVRPTGSGIDPLLLNRMQTARPGRGWWRMLLDQYGAADVISPIVRLKRSYPGGPAIGEFVARFGPDNRLLGRFRLRVENSAAIPRLLDEGVRRLDLLYTQALAAGILEPDPSLIIEEPEVISDVAEQIEASNRVEPAPRASTAVIPVTPTAGVVSVTIQVETPTSEVVQQAEIGVSRVPGVTSALTTNPAIGGTSIMRVTFAGDPAALASALAAQGWTVSGFGPSLRISRGGAAAPPADTPQP